MTPGTAAPAGMLLDTIATGVALGLRFNPLASVVGAVIAAAIAGTPSSGRDRRWYALAVLVGVWLVGDGTRVLARASDAAGGGAVAGDAPAWVMWAALVLWAVVGFAIGYALPAALGSAIGRRVTHGTGWLSAASVAFAFAVGLGQLAEPIAALVGRAAGS